MMFFKKRPLSGESEPAKPTPADQLRADIADLEAELAASNQALADLEKRMSAVEAVVMEAIRTGDDRAARASLGDIQSQNEKAAALKADVKVLRAILDECYEFVGKMSEPPPPP